MVQSKYVHKRLKSVCQSGGLKPFSALPAPKQHWLWGNLYDFTIGKRLQFHLVCQRWHQQLGPIYRCAACPPAPPVT